MGIADILKSRPTVGQKADGPLPKPVRAKATCRKPRASLRTYTAIAPESAAGEGKRVEFEAAERACIKAARHICQARLPDVCMVKAVTAHHVKLRSAGGGNEANNLIAVCRACHLRLHNHPAEAAKVGHIRRRNGTGLTKGADHAA